MLKHFLLLSNTGQQNVPGCSRGGPECHSTDDHKVKGTQLGTNMVQEVSYPKGSHLKGLCVPSPSFLSIFQIAVSKEGSCGITETW